MQKTGQIERTVDREFADEEAKFKTCVRSISLIGDSIFMIHPVLKKSVKHFRRIAKATLMLCEVCPPLAVDVLLLTCALCSDRSYDRSTNTAS